jgi:hypothetical protein
MTWKWAQVMFSWPRLCQASSSPRVKRTGTESIDTLSALLCSGVVWVRGQVHQLSFSEPIGCWVYWHAHHTELQLITALSLTYTLSKSLGHTHSSLIVSWQRIYNSLTVTTTTATITAHTKSSFHRLTFDKLNSWVILQSSSNYQLWNFQPNSLL